MASPRSCTAQIASYTQALRTMKKSDGCKNAATSRIASGLIRIEPRTASSASLEFGATRSPLGVLSVMYIQVYLESKTGPTRHENRAAPLSMSSSAKLFVFVQVIEIERVHKVLEDAQALIRRLGVAGFTINFRLWRVGG